MVTKEDLIKTLFVVVIFIAISACTPAVAQPPASTSVPVIISPQAPAPTDVSSPATATATPSPVKPQAGPTPTPGPEATPAQDKPVSLTMAVYDDHGSPIEPYVLEFIDQVQTLSGGSIIITPTWNASTITDPNTEQGVIKSLITGKFDLTAVATRAWDLESITSFQALQAPFLIDNDALALAVSTSDIAKQMLDSLSPAGAEGLAIWPEDLRHPFSVVDGKALLSPADFNGLTIRVPVSSATNMLISALGANPKQVDDGYQGAESGLRQGGTLNGRPTATGNVTFFSKFQGLYANGAAFKKLSQAQQTVLQQAAAAAQKMAITQHPSDADNGKAYCADGGAVVLASADQMAAFEKAAQPVFDSLEKDPFNAKMIAAIQDLKTKTTPSAGAAACGTMLAQAEPTSTPANVAWSTGPLPNGVWQITFSVDDYVRMGYLKSVAESDWAGTYTMTVEDGKLSWNWQGTVGQIGKCQGTTAVVGDHVELTYIQTSPAGDECPGEIDDLQWRLDAQGLHIHLVSIQNGNFHDGSAWWEGKPWQKVK
jgi:TRAP-type C4-dicarboxylate transport system substrate-binding protein